MRIPGSMICRCRMLNDINDFDDSNLVDIDDSHDGMGYNNGY